MPRGPGARSRSGARCVCLGHQGIALAYGGALAVGKEILHGQLQPHLARRRPAVRRHAARILGPCATILCSPLRRFPPVCARSLGREEGAVMGLAALIDRPDLRRPIPSGVLYDRTRRHCAFSKISVISRSGKTGASFLETDDDEEPFARSRFTPARRSASAGNPCALFWSACPERSTWRRCSRRCAEASIRLGWTARAEAWTPAVIRT